MTLTEFHAHPGPPPVYKGWRWAWDEHGTVCLCERCDEQGPLPSASRRAQMDGYAPLFSAPGPKVPLSALRSWLTEVQGAMPAGALGYTQFNEGMYEVGVLAAGLSLYDDLDIRVTAVQVRLDMLFKPNLTAAETVLAFRSKNRIAICAPVRVKIVEPFFETE